MVVEECPLGKLDLIELLDFYHSPVRLEALHNSPTIEPSRQRLVQLGETSRQKVKRYEAIRAPHIIDLDLIGSDRSTDR